MLEKLCVWPTPRSRGACPWCGQRVGRRGECERGNDHRQGISSGSGCVSGSPVEPALVHFASRPGKVHTDGRRKGHSRRLRRRLYRSSSLDVFVLHPSHPLRASSTSPAGLRCPTVTQTLQLGRVPRCNRRVWRARRRAGRTNLEPSSGGRAGHATVISLIAWSIQRSSDPRS